ncbi:hypothetical protein GOM71_04835 [Paenibacillus sp. NEAU-GSW1]|nr:hypothetical protein [Paenibacillus sp. NEAU-GSW1]
MPKAEAAQSKLPFDDIATSFAMDSIINLYNKKILTGTSATTFAPKNPVTRAEFVAILGRTLGLEQAISPISPFSDVAANAWYYGWVQAAVQLGLADGTSATAFAPAKAVTRQEAAVLLVRAFKLSNTTAAQKAAFKDSAQIADWAADSIASVNKLSLMQGDTDDRFRPADPLTRQETAAILDRALQNDNWASALEQTGKQKIQLGWQYGQTASQFEQSVTASKMVNTLSPRWYFADKSGNITDNTNQSLITWAAANKKAIWAMVGNRSDQETTHQLLSSAAARTNLVTNLANAVQKYKLAGLNIDFENVAPQDRSHMTAFITELNAKLDSLNAILSVNVSPDLGTDWTEAFDYKALGAQADFIIMMGYDEHWGGSPKAGSVASLPFVRNAVTTLLKVVPAEKTILALPYYNRDWTLNANGSAAYSEVLTVPAQNELVSEHAMKPLWDSSVSQYTASYKENGAIHRIWLEDGRSLAAKYKAAADNSLAGTAYWYIGGESEDIWASLRNAERFYNLKFAS